MHNQAHDRPDSLAAGLVIDLTAPYSEVRAYGRDGGPVARDYDLFEKLPGNPVMAALARDTQRVASECQPGCTKEDLSFR